jgi:hypothetical protein
MDQSHRSDASTSRTSRTGRPAALTASRMAAAIPANSSARADDDRYASPIRRDGAIPSNRRASRPDPARASTATAVSGSSVTPIPPATN